MPKVSLTNPLTNSNKLKLGVFHLNGSSGARTVVPERFHLSWENVLKTVRAADAGGFEAIVPFSRWASETSDFGHESGVTYETLTWAAAVGAVTSYSCIMSTVHVMHIHPIYAAKAMATIDHVTGGRFALNIVCGWVPEDMRMFRHEDFGNEGRYAYAEEWTEILKLLWTSEKPMSFRGRYLSVEDAWSAPKPVQTPHPLLMNAGGSDQGKQFVAKQCDVAFIRTESHERMKAQAKAYRDYVRDNYGRDIQIWIQAYVVQRDSYEEAERYVQHYAVDHADVEHIDAILKIRNRPLEGAEAVAYRRNLGAGPGGLPLIGSPQDIARGLEELSSLGIDGVLLNWVDPVAGVTDFARDVMPLLEQSGLRTPMAAPRTLETA